MAVKKRIFVSYAREDAAWCDLFEGMLRPLEFDVWIDQHAIRAGAQWNDEIDKGLREADAALLLISRKFLNSKFISEVELPHLLDRRAAGMLVVPVLIEACPWKQIDWLKKTDIRPRGGKPPGRGCGPASAPGAALATDIVIEFADLLRQAAAADPAPRPAGATADPAAAARHLLAQVLLGAQDPKSRQEIAAQLVERIAAFTRLSGLALFDAARLFIEFHLLRSNEPFSPLALMGSLDQPAADANARRLHNCLERLKRGAPARDYAQVRVQVNAMFFMLAREREAQWQAYFETLRDAGVEAVADEDIATLALVDAQWGFIAPQFLVAGLLSRFEDDWRPVLNVYRASLPKAGARDGGFASLQASQWNCWLVWGPSAPICRCPQWRGHYAFQYGYGDENNSLPLFDLRAKAGEGVLGDLAATVAARGQGAGAARLTGRLKWAPFVFRPDPEQPLDGQDEECADDVDDVDAIDDDPEAPPPRPLPKRTLANVQAALLCGDSLAHVNRSDGLMVQADELEPSAAPRGYFSAYLWMMFLVAGPLVDEAGPRLLWGRAYPDWPKHAGDRLGVRSKQLWRDLLPAFVHANVADAAALAFQRRNLIEIALSTLRQVWQARAQCFDDADLEAGIHFYLVCASDYSGCGDSIRFAPDESLTTLMAHRLADEKDGDFVNAVVLPAADESTQTRPWGLAGYFSSCHLNELVGDYFTHVAKLSEEAKVKAQRRG